MPSDINPLMTSEKHSV